MIDKKILNKIDNHLNVAEYIKKNSNFLRGTISEDLNNSLTGGFIGDNYSLIRFHGMYQQDDRDIRKERLKQKLEPRYSIMLRCRLPGGIITTKQWLNIEKFAGKHTIYGSIRLTNRQTFQLHGILKKKLKSIHQLLNKIKLDSLATANDVNRNVLCTSNPMKSTIHLEAYKWAKKISEYLLPKTNAYSEIWLNKKKLLTTDIEPILGSTYLPRKFKTSILIPPENDVDLHANDLNFIAISDNENKKLIGFNILIGGGLSIEHGNKKTYPRLSTELGYIPLYKIISITKAIITTQRDWGNRIDRKNAKTRYTIERVGINKFKKEIEKRAKIKFEKIKPYILKYRGDYIGWTKGINGLWNLTIFIENGRILNYSKFLIKNGIKEIAKIHKGNFRITANQNLIISDVLEKEKKNINNLAIFYGLINNNISKQRQNSMACVSFPTCPLAMAEAERILPEFITKIEIIMNKNNINNNYIIFRISGCPNGCARALLAEIGLIGKSLNKYNLYLGGNREGTRIARIYKENIKEKEIFKELNNLIKLWAKNKKKEENFGDFVIRAKIVKPVINSVKDFWL
ncbi:assimilatory sulfite reductase (NADPH) hemoprotein subunit [Enterobacterales bacterium endosymbiont of Anomoneura mori]|uniref:assimilatory sulfite reductase (NADPH) hemoprotein subunit n=1 Tax=Enterobacterales bacterium endosymbiont of Anomoneura mori TaxID=3132096 RepID=UPI00399D2B5E